MISHGGNPLTGYYISNSGSAANDGLSPTTPKTLAGLSSFDFSKRCCLFFKRGEIFNTSFTVANKNVHVAGYGEGAPPIIRGSTDISILDWTNEGDGTWSTVTAEMDMVYINNLCAKLSETPWIEITSYPATNRFGINNADVAAYGTITGSRLTWLARPWTTEYVYTVSAYSSSIITINTATTTQTSVAGTTLKLLGKKAYMVDANEWAYEGGKLYIKSTESPATMNIRASNHRVGITVSSGAHGFECHGIEFQDFYYSAIQRNQADNVVINDCTAKNCNGYAFSTIGNANFLNISNNTITNCNGGIYDIATRNYTFNGNTIYNIGMMGNIGSMPDYNCVIAPNKAIYARDLNSTGFLHSLGTISGNTIYNVASTGIHFQGNVKCYENIVHDFMQLFSDGGGIYCYASANYTNIGSEIYKNIVYDGGPDACSGIYVDNRCISFDIHDNVIEGMSMAGINMNWDKRATSCRNNIIVDCLYGMRYTQGGTWTAYEFNIANVSIGNIIACRSNVQFCHRMEVNDDSVNFNPFTSGSSNNNYYISPYIGRVAWHTDDTSMSFSEMKVRYGTDAASATRNLYKTYVDQAQAEIDVLLLTNETDTDVVQQLDSGYIDVAGNSITQVTVPAYGGYVALKS